MSGFFFHTPGWVDQDLPNDILQAWSDHQSCDARDNIAQMLAHAPGSTLGSIPYAHPSDGAIPGQVTTTYIDWDGFPGRARFQREPYAFVSESGGGDIGPLTDADGSHLDWPVRMNQDEYLEWNATYDQGRLTSITFVAEGYDYYGFLFDNGAHEHVADLYSNYTGATVTPDDLRAPTDILSRRSVVARRGQFNPRNTFNLDPGIVHLSHKANSLGAEVNLAVTSCLPRLDKNGRVVVGDHVAKLLCCTAGGEPNRTSDPRIAQVAYGAVTSRDNPSRFTLTDPIGLYIREFRNSALQYPEGDETCPYEWWQVQRGKDAANPGRRDDSRILRLHLEVPASEGFSLGDMRIRGRQIQHPAELVKLIDMHLMVDLWAATAPAPAVACESTCCEDGKGFLEILRSGEGTCAERGGQDAFPELLPGDQGGDHSPAAAISRPLLTR